MSNAKTQSGVGEELNPFKIAQSQLDRAAQKLKLDPGTHAILREPMRDSCFHSRKNGQWFSKSF